jgi:quinol monooxygenase YgiN
MSEGSDTKVVALARVAAKEGKEAPVRAALMGLLAPSRQEPGCLRFDLYISAEDPREFVIDQAWSSREAMDRYLNAPYVTELAVHASEFLVQPPEIVLLREHEDQG